jgi:ATP-dependent Clp protease ATP-binding subunit ClpA
MQTRVMRTPDTNTEAPVSVPQALICRLAEQASRAVSPDEALRLIRQLREEIDAFERQKVAAALTAGRSTASVARALGVTRQSAHRRFRELITPGTPDQRPWPTPETRVVAERARSEARALAAPAIGSEHLLVAILCFGDHPAVAALNRLGVAHDDARSALRTDSLANRRAADLQHDVKRALAAARACARRNGCEQIGIEHLLLGALQDPASGANTTLRALGVTPDAVIAAVTTTSPRGAP